MSAVSLEIGYILLGVHSEESNMPMAPITINTRQPCDELYIKVTRKIIAARSSLSKHQNE